MDYYIRQYYSGDKVPKGILTVNTSNAQSFWSFWDTFIENVKKNPHAIHPLIHQSEQGKEPIKWVDFMRSLKEMEYTDVRNEIRTQIGAVYNVSPIFQNDTSIGGGLNNEGLQIKVTDRGIEMGQRIYNDKILPWMCDQLGITDYKWSLLPSREIDRVYEKDLKLKDIQIARAMAELGIDVTFNETGEFSFGAGKVSIQSQGIQQDFQTSSLYDHLEDTFQTSSITKSLKKDISITEQEKKKLENALLTELKKLLKRFDTKKPPSPEELNQKISEVVKDFDKIIKSKNSKKLKAIYRQAMQQMSKELGENFTLTDKDKYVIEALKHDPVYQEAFSNMSTELSNKLRQAVEDAYKDPNGFSIDKLVNNMKEYTDTTENTLRRIARTETSKISAACRKVQYDKTGKTYKFYHIGPDDDRTSEISKEIKRLTKNGVSWDDYVKIIKTVSKKYNPKWIVNELAPIPFPNTRHTFKGVRVD